MLTETSSVVPRITPPSQAPQDEVKSEKENPVSASEHDSCQLSQRTSLFCEGIVANSGSGNAARRRISPSSFASILGEEAGKPPPSLSGLVSSAQQPSRQLQQPLHQAEARSCCASSGPLLSNSGRVRKIVFTLDIDDSADVAVHGESSSVDFMHSDSR